VGQGKERRSKATTRNEEDGKTKTRKEEKFAGTSIGDAVRKCFRSTFILSTGKNT
jgi:hypothetical protein